MAGARANRVWMGLAAALLLLAGLALAFFVAQRPPDGPVEVPLDRVACARCGMLVSEIAFAGQLHTREGEVLFYDDPGCLLLDAVERAAQARAHWFHAHGSERWLSAEEVSFTRAEPTPMGYGLAAQPRGEGPLDPAAALALARAREASLEGHR